MNLEEFKKLENKNVLVTGGAGFTLCNGAQLHRVIPVK